MKNVMVAAFAALLLMGCGSENWQLRPDAGKRLQDWSANQSTTPAVTNSNCQIVDMGGGYFEKHCTTY